MTARDVIGLSIDVRRHSLAVRARLTVHQRHLVAALLGGSTNREIAKQLGLHEQTVKNQLSVIYGKLGVRTRLDLAVHAGRRGLLEDEPEA